MNKLIRYYTGTQYFDVFWGKPKIKIADMVEQKPVNDDNAVKPQVFLANYSAMLREFREK